MRIAKQRCGNCGKEIAEIDLDSKYPKVIKSYSSICSDCMKSAFSGDSVK